MKKITVYQSEYQPDTFEDTDETYKVQVLEHGALRVEAAGDLVIYNRNTWHSVSIEEVDA